jgi:hypothetical protein
LPGLPFVARRTESSHEVRRITSRRGIVARSEIQTGGNDGVDFRFYGFTLLSLPGLGPAVGVPTLSVCGSAAFAKADGKIGR